MNDQFRAMIERDGVWFVALSTETPGANGQGHSIEDCQESPKEAIRLIVEDKRGDVLRGLLIR